MSPIETNVDIILLALLEERGYIRRENLIKTVLSKYKGTSGFSKPTIDRKIAQLEHKGKIQIIKHEGLKSFGISDPNKNASYLFHEKYLKSKRQIDEIIPLLTSREKEDSILALEEICRYQDEYQLTSIQLDSLVNLICEDRTLTALTLSILSDYVFNRKISPLNKDEFIKKLRFILSQFENNLTIEDLTDIPSIFEFANKPDKRNVYENAIHLLGYYKDDSVFHQLIRDLQDLERFSRIWYYYKEVNTSAIIDKHQSELFKIQLKLRKEGKFKAAELLSLIRTDAKRLVKFSH
jgi:hypothetical protein